MLRFARRLHTSTMSATCLFDGAMQAFVSCDAAHKAELTQHVFSEFEAGRLPVLASDFVPVAPPARPGRPADVEEGERRHVKTGSRKALVHSLVHAESYAIDLAWDIILRFGRPGEDGELPFPKEFYYDFAKVAFDEAVHYSRWEARLREIDGFYGCMKTHRGLWDAATETADSLALRLTLINCIHEARGLDNAPFALKKFRKAGDEASEEILHKNLADEVTHVAAGVKWLTHMFGSADAAKVKFQELARTVYKGVLRGPFDIERRASAGLTEDWYMPLTKSVDEPASGSPAADAADAGASAGASEGAAAAGGAGGAGAGAVSAAGTTTATPADAESAPVAAATGGSEA